MTCAGGFRVGPEAAGVLAGLLLVTACGAAPEGGAPGEGSPADVPAAVTQQSVRPEATGAWPPGEDSIPGTPWTGHDWEIFQSTLRTAQEHRLDTLPLGDAIAEMAALFLGTPYVPQTLEVPGPERLVVNLRGLDCVTLVENVLALTRFHRVHGAALLDDPAAARRRYEADLAALRYRDGAPDGYASRLHYFSEWLARGEAAGRLEMVTAGLGGVPDPEPVSFMTTHREAYRQLGDASVLEAMAGVEARLAAAGPRTYLPEDAIAEAAPGIRNGDLIAATSTLAGLDVAHTGFAYWVDGALHLLHAPLVGSTVVLSERPLAQRILEIGTQDGIVVARPRADWFRGGR